jgi:hypothetical protein
MNRPGLAQPKICQAREYLQVLGYCRLSCGKVIQNVVILFESIPCYELPSLTILLLQLSDLLPNLQHSFSECDGGVWIIVESLQVQSRTAQRDATH